MKTEAVKRFLPGFLILIVPTILIVGVLFYQGNKAVKRYNDSAEKLTDLTRPGSALSPAPLAAVSPAGENSVLGTQSATTATPSSKLNPLTMTQPPPMEIDVNKKYTALLKTTAGDITVELTAKQTPITVNNFVFLARNNFYDGTIFHRVIKGFMIQGGDPKGDGTGGPGYRFADEPITGEYSRGTVAMANAGPNTNGSQFFIMQADTPLPKNYVIFGKVTVGLDVVDKIATAPTQPGGEGSRPVDPTKVASVEINER